MTKHTPQFWKFNDNSEWYKTNPFSITVRKRGVHSAVVANIPSRTTIPHEEAKANALLIAAAPDLLEALIDVLKYDGYEIPATEYNKARAAITKATGEA